MTMPKRDSHGHFIKASAPVAKASKVAAAPEAVITAPVVPTPAPAARSVMVVEVTIGSNTVEVKIPGTSATVAQALTEAQKILGIPVDGMTVTVNGEAATRETCVSNKAQIEAVKPAGSKASF